MIDLKELERRMNEQIESFDIEEILKDVLESLVRTHFGNNGLSKMIDKVIDPLLKVEVEKIMHGPIITNDGWGKSQSFNSFEEVFKSYFEKQLKDSYKVPGMIERAVKTKVEELFNTKYLELANKFAEELVK